MLFQPWFEIGYNSKAMEYGAIGGRCRQDNRLPPIGWRQWERDEMVDYRLEKERDSDFLDFIIGQ